MELYSNCPNCKIKKPGLKVYLTDSDKRGCDACLPPNFRGNVCGKICTEDEWEDNQKRKLNKQVRRQDLYEKKLKTLSICFKVTVSKVIYIGTLVSDTNLFF